jgi:hypothetical protein
MATVDSTATGFAGTVYITDDGTTVRFYIKNTSSATYASGKSWTGRVNATNVSGTYSINGVQTVLVASYVVTTTQTVTFTMAATGTSGLAGPATASGVVSRATVPATPATPTVGTILSTSLKVSWVIPSNGGSAITQMYLRRFPTSASATANTGFTDTTLGATITSATVSGLSPKTSYWWKVIAKNAVGNSAPSAVVVGLTSDKPETPAAPVVASKTATSINLTLTDPDFNSAPITGRQTQLSTSSSFSTVQATVTTTTPTFTAANGVLRNTLYYTRWQAVNSVGPSDWSGTTSVQTDVQLPSAPANYTAVDIGSTTAYSSLPSVSDNGGSSLINMTAQYNTTASSTGATTVTAGTYRAAFFSGLTANTTYWYRLAVTNGGTGGGIGPYGSWVSFTTKSNVPNPPGSVAASLLANTTARISWVAPTTLNGATINGYSLRVSSSPAFSTGSLVYTLGNVLLQDLTGLQPGTTYYAQVWSTTTNGSGSYSTPISFLTTGTAPAPAAFWNRIAGIWKPGILWLRVAGVQKQVTPWIRVSGTWRKL